MEHAGLGALVLGRPAEVACASGARRAVGRPLRARSAPPCRGGGHPVGSICCRCRTSTCRPRWATTTCTACPGTRPGLAAALAAIPGLVDAERVGFHPSSPGLPRLLAGPRPGPRWSTGAGRCGRPEARSRPLRWDRHRGRLWDRPGGAGGHGGRAVEGCDRGHTCWLPTWPPSPPPAPRPLPARAWPAPPPLAARWRCAGSRREPIEAGQLVALDAGGFFRATRAAWGAPARAAPRPCTRPSWRSAVEPGRGRDRRLLGRRHRVLPAGALDR